MTSRFATLRSTRTLLMLLLLAVLASSGCARISKLWKDENKNEGVPVEELYARGHDAIKDERWGSATEAYTRLIAQYPYGPYTEQALIETAYADFKAASTMMRSPPSTASSGPTRPIATSPISTTCAACPTPPRTRYSCRRCSRSR